MAAARTNNMATEQSPLGSALFRSSLQEYIARTIVFLAALVQIKLQGAKELPFLAEFAIITSTVAMQIYCLAMYAEEKLVNTNPEAAKIVGYYGSLCGFLTVVLLLLMLDQALGWINFGVWLCSFLVVTYWSYKEIFDMLCWAIHKASEKLKTPRPQVGAFFNRLRLHGSVTEGTV